MNLFAYGTLLDRKVITRILGRNLPQAVPATLHGYRRYETRAGYPIILPEAGACCEGAVFFSLTPTDWERLDIYEDTKSNPPAYFRRMVTARGTHGSISAQTYIGNLKHSRTRIIS